jgi:hypothetical protein
MERQPTLEEFFRGQQTPKEVRPKYIDGWNFSLHPGGPKLDIVCGNCGAFFRNRVPTSVPYPKIGCPHCHALNVIPVVPAFLL